MGSYIESEEKRTQEMKKMITLFGKIDNFWKNATKSFRKAEKAVCEDEKDFGDTLLVLNQGCQMVCF
jgi:hypothetical protein